MFCGKYFIKKSTYVKSRKKLHILSYMRKIKIAKKIYKRYCIIENFVI